MADDGHALNGLRWTRSLAASAEQLAAGGMMIVITARKDETVIDGKASSR